MATNVISEVKIDTDKEDVLFIFCNESANPRDGDLVEKYVSQISNHFRRIDSMGTCYSICESSKLPVIIMVVEELVHGFVPKIHDLKQVLAIYVWSVEREEHVKADYKIDYDELQKYHKVT